jgi:hypothetical protein
MNASCAVRGPHMPAKTARRGRLVRRWRVPVGVDTSGVLAGKTLTQVTVGQAYAFL